MLIQDWQNQIGFVSRIDQQGFPGFFASHDVAVALQWPNRNGFQNQAPSQTGVMPCREE